MHRSGVAMAWNVFKFCTALRGLGSIMILLVLGVVGVTYYAVVLTNYGPALYDGGLDSLIAFLVLILFHSLLVMLLWSYFSVVLTDPGSVPPNWRPAIDEERGEADPLNGSEFTGVQPDPSNQRIRYCRKCNQLKPPRCHHCSVCGRCVLKMDHHCVWVVNCVGALNYKYFLLFLGISSSGKEYRMRSLTKLDYPANTTGSFQIPTSFGLSVKQSTLTKVKCLLGADFSSGVFYTFVETSLVTLSLLPHFIAFFSDGEIPGTPGTLATTFLAFVLNLAFALSVMGFLIMHISLVAANTTTIEAYEKKTTPKWRYDLGRKKNFEQVFGADQRYWFIPAYSEEDLRRMPALQGLDYPSKPDFDSEEF
ncbi:Zinc finger, DHHC-type, palmitoyltransferase [Parasponia andersonii]|uniref:S-acyltransferase n=1 Tax=Parasponia andersonii TaxID=3476 RepID=A0A2P5BHW0_PARAD|nr:Zinc finger, DHHC-type, palmitoyltransferase [Parasponia andersonii]